MLVRPLRGLALRGFPEEFSANLIRPYVPGIKRARERGDTNAEKVDGGKGVSERERERGWAGLGRDRNPIFRGQI